MERKRKLSYTVLICLLLTSCMEISTHSDVEILLQTTAMSTRSALPDEEKISDVNLLIFDSYGRAEYRTYSSETEGFRVSLLNGERYIIYALVNFGYEISVESEETLKKTKYHLIYPDEYRNGIPMCASTEIHVGQSSEITLEPIRLMSKVSLRIDRSKLSDVVRMDVRTVRIGNCPNNIKVFANSRAENEDDCFASGFYLDASACSPLNTGNAKDISDEISLYMLENMQGDFSSENIETDDQKVFDEYDIRSRTCSYIELEMDYSSDEWTSISKPLTYRFYLGENRNNLDIERNCHYHITVCPENDGLNGDGWRVDKTGLKYTGEIYFEKYPSGYIRGNIGDKIHLGCIVKPLSAPFDVGESYLKDDKAEGIYDYEIDADGHGVTLTLTGPGSGLIYMEAGDPVNEAALFIVEVNLPD